MADPSQRRVLILGADGFIGRHIAFALRDRGWNVLASARRPERLEQMGFDTLKVDLTSAEAQKQDFWRPHLANIDAIINAAGLLSASETDMLAVHSDAPGALYAARPDGTAGLLLSAIGIDDSDTPFARHRRAGEDIAQQHKVMILRPGLVLGDTSYGGSSLVRALAISPWRTPVIGSGDQIFNPLHGTDLAHVIADMLETPTDSTPRSIGGPESLSQTNLIAAYRAWLGLPAIRPLRMPLRLAIGLGRVGDWLRMGPLSANAVRQLETGVHAPTDQNLSPYTHHIRPFSKFLGQRPAGTQDLWHARLFLIKPLLRLTLAFLWLVSGLLGLFLPSAAFLPLVPDQPETTMILLARLGGFADVALAAALLRNWRPKLINYVQLAIVTTYTLAFTILAASLWLLPLGGLLKNLPILLLLLIHMVLTEER